MAPLIHASAVPALLSLLHVQESSDKLIVAALRTLNTIADALGRTLDSGSIPAGASLSTLMFQNAHMQRFKWILTNPSESSIVQRQIALAASLIAKTCREEWQQAALASCGMLEILATLLAGFVVAMGFVLPGAEAHARRSGHAEFIPKAAPRTAELHPILDAINAIIHDSKFRAAQFLYASSIRAVFPNLSADNTLDGAMKSGPVDQGSASAHANPIDYLLPQVPTAFCKHSSSGSSAFPPLGSGGHRSRRLGGAEKSCLADQTPSDLDPSSSNTVSTGNVQDEESPLIAWLIYLTRGEHDITRLLAATLLTVLYRAGLASKKREMALALLIVPLLVGMLDENPSPLPGRSQAYPTTGYETCRIELTILELAPAVLATLVTDSLELQKAAVDAQAIKKLSQLLKSAYSQSPQAKQVAFWTPTSSPPPEPETNGSEPMATEESMTCRLGDPGLSSAAVHRMKVRGSTLKALAALAPFKDEYRKMIIENGVTPLIVESLKPVKPGNPTDGQTREDGIDNGLKGLAGNPAFVLIAACGAVRALSRSVSILRTSLIDAGVAMPLFSLLTNRDLEVQIAATAAVCNLVLEFSPMREVRHVPPTKTRDYSSDQRYRQS